MQTEKAPIIPPEEPAKTTEKPESSLQEYQETPLQVEALKKVARSEDVFNVLKDMPPEQNIVTGDGGWKNEISTVGGPVYLFPSLQLPQYSCNDDLNYITSLLPRLNEFSLSSGYMAFPQSLITQLSKCAKLNLLSASPEVISIQANGFLNDGIKNWIPYLYKASQEVIKSQVKNAEFQEYSRKGWTFHAKGIWAEDHSGVYFSSIGSSNYSYRSYHRDSEFQLYMWSNCPLFKKMLSDEKNRLWKYSESSSSFSLKYGIPTRLLTKLLKSYL